MTQTVCWKCVGTGGISRWRRCPECSGTGAVETDKPCQAIQYSDEMACSLCGLRWDTNDPAPPPCNPDRIGR